MNIGMHQYEVYIRATPQQVWHALLDPEMTRQYFHGTAFDRPPVQGERFSTSIAGGGPAVDGVVEVLDPPHRLVHTWHVLYDAELADEPVSRVEWIVELAGEGLTRLRVVHSDLAQSPKTWADVRHGWVWILDGLKTLLETGTPLPGTTDEPERPDATDDVDGDWHRMQAIEANNSVWQLVERASRTAADDEEMLQRAYTSRYHWARASGREPANVARGAWLVAKVQLLVGSPELSLRYADECLEVCEEHGLVDFDLAYAHEARARALHALGREDEASVAWKSAHAVQVADPEDRALLEADLAVGPG